MSISSPPVQSASANSSSCAYGSNNAAGNLLVAGLQDSVDPAGITLSDTRGNTWVKAVGLYASGPGLSGSIWYVENCAAGANTVTVAGGTASFQELDIAEYSGAATSSPLDQTAIATSSSTAPDSGATATTSQAAELVVGLIALSGVRTVTWGNSFTGRQSSNNTVNRQADFGDLVVSSTGAYHAAATLSSASDWVAAVATFRGAAAGPATAYAAPAPATVDLGQTATVPVAPNGTFTGTITGTPSGSAATGLSPVVLTFSGPNTPQNATWMPTVTGTLTITWTNSGSLTNPGNSTITVNSALVAGTVSFDSCGPAGGSPFIKMTATPATGGTVTVSGQWQRKTGSGGTYVDLSNGSVISGATSLALTDGSATSGNDYFYRINYTDSATTPVTVGSAGVEAKVYTGEPFESGGGSFTHSGQRRRGR